MTSQSGNTIQIITKSGLRQGAGTGQAGSAATVLKTLTTSQAAGVAAATASTTAGNAAGVTTKYITIPVSAASSLLNLAPGTAVSQIVANTAKIAAGAATAAAAAAANKQGK